MTTAIKQVVNEVLWCRRCSFGVQGEWRTRKTDGTLPVRCPRCSSIKWDTPKEEEQPCTPQ